MAVPKWARENMAKTGGQPTFGVVSKPSLFHSSPVKLADGGGPTEAELKRMGLEASNRYAEIEKSQEQGFLDKVKGVGGRFFDRLTAGNIDAPGSRAYEQYGAGLGKKEYEAEQARKQSVVDTERARKEYVPETAAEISARMGKVPAPGSAVDSKPVTSTTEPATTTVTPVKTDSDWETLQRSSENKPVDNTNANKPNGVFSNPTKYIGGRTDNQPSKVEEKPAQTTTRKVVKKRKASANNSSNQSSSPPTKELAIASSIPYESQDSRQQKAVASAPSNNNNLASRPYPTDARPTSQFESNSTRVEAKAEKNKPSEDRKAKFDQAEALRQKYLIARNVYNKSKTAENKKKYEDLRDQYRAIDAELRKK